MSTQLNKKEKLAIQKLLSAGQILSNIAFNMAQIDDRNQLPAKESYRRWDTAYSEAKTAIRKLKLPPF